MSTELSSAEPCPPTTERSRTLKEKDWEPFKSCIIDMHITRDLSLEEVRRHLKATHGFDATYAYSSHPHRLFELTKLRLDFVSTEPESASGSLTRR